MKIIKKFLNLSDKNKTIIILPILILNNIIFTPLVDFNSFYTTIAAINIVIVTSILIPLVFIIPFLYESKLGFLYYLYFITNSANLFWWIVVIINQIYNKNNIWILLPLFIGILIAFKIIMDKKSMNKL